MSMELSARYKFPGFAHSAEENEEHPVNAVNEHSIVIKMNAHAFFDIISLFLLTKRGIAKAICLERVELWELRKTR